MATSSIKDESIIPKFWNWFARTSCQPSKYHLELASVEPIIDLTAENQAKWNRLIVKREESKHAPLAVNLDTKKAAWYKLWHQLD